MGCVSLSISHTRPGYPGLCGCQRERRPLFFSPLQSMALALCCGVSKGSPSLLSQQRPTKKQKGVLKLSKKKTTPHPAQTRPVSEASVRVQRFSLCDSISEVSLLVATELFSSHTRGAAQPQLSRLSDTDGSSDALSSKAWLPSCSDSQAVQPCCLWFVCGSC